MNFSLPGAKPCLVPEEKGRCFGLIEVFNKLLGAVPAREVLQNTRDKRLCISTAAKLMGAEEDSFSARVAQELGLQFMAKLPPVEQRFVGDGALFERYFALGALPVRRENGEMALACANPDLLSAWTSQRNNSMLRLATWERIKVAWGMQDAAATRITRREPPLVLIIDDNEVFCRVLERFLAREGLRVTCESSASGALTRLTGEAVIPDIIVCDVHMPLMDGTALLRQMRKNMRLSRIPIVMLTSDTDVELELLVLNCGADMLLTKNDDPRLLAAYVKRLLDQSLTPCEREAEI